jgi:phosphatidylserine decarboxylase
MTRLHNVNRGAAGHANVLIETTTTATAPSGKRTTSFASQADYEFNIQSKKFSPKVRLYKRLPLKTMSRAWGEINSIDLPIWARRPCFHLYAWMFKCNLEEMDSDDITQFKNLSEFFRRALKPDVRVINQQSCLISPCDGRVLHFGKVSDDGYLEQVKGVNYSLQEFLGKQTWPLPRRTTITASGTVMPSAVSYERNLLSHPDNCLFHCVIYLAPGDYHRFHSPTDWTIFSRRHFPGELFSVNPKVVSWLKGVFNLNERVAYYGQWKYGFFSMTPVGATNVGSIKVYKDEELITNVRSKTDTIIDEEKLYKTFKTTESAGVEMRRGDPFGEFNLGSTIVLIFEAPQDFQFHVTPNERVFYGIPLGETPRSQLTSNLLVEPVKPQN